MNINELKKNNSETSAVSFIKRDIKLAAVLSKNVNDSNNNNANSPDKFLDNIGFNNFYNLSSKRAKRNSDAQAILKLLPDVALGKQILISSILSPKDMMSTDLRFLLPKNLLSPEISSSLLNMINDYFSNEYNIKSILSIILEEALFDKGSYPVAVLPESAIDDFINGNKVLTTENFKSLMNVGDKTFKSIGILGSPKNNDSVSGSFSFENLNFSESKDINNSNITYDKKEFVQNIKDNDRYETDDSLFVTDNFSILSLPRLHKFKLSSKISEIYSNHSSSKSNFSTESLKINKLSDNEIKFLIDRERDFTNERIASFKTENELNRKSVGEPLILKLPSESVIPVHVPGDVRKQVGFFILLDQNGNPVEIEDGDHDYSSLNNSLNSNNVNSNIVSRVGTNLGLNNFKFDGSNQTHINEASRIYGRIIENDLKNRLKNGVYNTNYEIAGNDEIYRLMLSRSLAKKYTQILYLPVEYMTYFAFKYTDDGLGKSLLDDAMTINTLRTVLMFSDMIGQIKNAIGRTKVTGTLPPNDPNPMKTIEKIMDETVRSRTVNMPLTVSNPNDITEYLQRVGYEWEWDGHPGLPNLKLAYEQINNNYSKVDSELTENLKNASIAHMGLTPEVIESGLKSPDFATTIVSNNILLSKRVSTLQDIFTPLLSDHIKKVVKNSQSLNDSIKEMIEKNIDKLNIKLEELVDDETIKALSEDSKNKLLVLKITNLIINGLYVELPKPDSVTLEKQMEDLSTYTDGLDKVLDAYISTDLFTSETAGELSNQIDSIRNQIKAYYVRKWLSDKGIFNEIAELVVSDEEGKPIMNISEIIKSHVQILSKTGIEVLVSLKDILEDNNKEIENKIGVLEPEEVTSGGTSEGDGQETDIGLDSNMGDLGLDIGTDETPTDENTDGGEEGTDTTKTDTETKDETGDDKGESKPDKDLDKDIPE